MKHAGAPMPDSLRHFMRAKAHPARSVACPHCGVAAHRPCTTRTGRRTPAELHPQRISEWAQTVACCPDCQVTPEVPCHDEGRARFTVHARRYQEAEETAA
ncbi:zinc finger domain-containing protein [Streptomyces sp. NPDC055243]|uniref:zinc finger domain-containing protein n=1 Tax=Streptomyces sp. NPDC055243 TaxID=3365720 RepID=UPI0037D51104